MVNFPKTLHKSHTQELNNGYLEENAWMCNEMGYTAQNIGNYHKI